MTTSAGPGALGMFGVVLLRLGTTDRLTAFVRPASRPYVVAAGVVLVVIGGAAWLSTPHRGTRAPTSRIGWLALAPVLALALVTPPPQGAVIGIRRSAAPPRAPGVVDTLRGPEPITLRLSELVARAVWGPRTLRGHRLRVIGFVRPTSASAGFTLARLSITCCAADAQEDDVEVRMASRSPPPPAGGWVVVVGWFAGVSTSDRFVPEVLAASVSTVRAPANPYD